MMTNVQIIMKGKKETIPAYNKLETQGRVQTSSVLKIWTDLSFVISAAAFLCTPVESAGA